MNNNFKLIYEKKNITETEQQLMSKLLETDFDKVVNKAGVGKDQSDEVPVLESILKAYKNDNQTFLFVTYSKGRGLGVTCVCIPNQLLEDRIREKAIDELVEEYVSHSGSFEKILDEAKNVMRYEFLSGDE